MNFDAIDKMSSSCVTEILKNIPGAQATRQLLILTRNILDSFLDKSLSVNHRIYLMWYSNFFFRLWRFWIKDHPTYCLGKNWISLNSYICIELNAHALLILTEKYREEPELLLPWLFSSQPCEKFFRQTRSMTSTYSTVVNFDMLDILRRQQRIQVINEIVSDSDEKFVFPREGTSRMGNKCTPCQTKIPSVEEIRDILEDARANALHDFKGLGMLLSVQEEKEALEEVLLTRTDDLENDEITIIHDVTINNAASNDASYNATEDEQELLEDIEQFKNIKKCNIKDFSGNEKPKNNSFLKVQMANKIVTVKESTLCWIFSDSSERLSSDRLSRFKGSQKNKLKTSNNKNKNETNIDNASETSDSSISYTLRSDTDSDNLSEPGHHENPEKLPNISIKNADVAMTGLFHAV